MSSEDYVLREEFNEAKKDIDKRLTEHDKEIATLKVICSNLQNLPDEVARLKTDMVLANNQLSTQNNLMCNLTKDLQDYMMEQKKKDAQQNQQIKEIDEKGKLDIVEWAKNNWTQIATIIAVLTILVKEYL